MEQDTTGRNRRAVMADEDLDKQFRQVADSFISVANSQLDVMNKENVGMALLYAASRFNAFVVASNSANLEAFKGDRDKAMEFFGAEYLRMLGANLSDHELVFEEDKPYGHLPPRTTNPS
jgi:hypothetical protein